MRNAMEEIKRPFRDIIQHSPDGVIITDNNIIQYTNETGLKILGASQEEELINKSILDFIHPDFHSIASERAASVGSGNITDFFEYQFIRLDGTLIDVEIKGIPTNFQDRPINCIYIRDLTERKKTQQMLLQAEKLNLAGQLAAGIAHEVRNPLTAIKGFLQLTKSEVMGKKTYLDIIQAEISRIEIILSELLTLSKPNDLKFEFTDLRILIKDVKTLIDAQAIMSNVRIVIKFPEQEPFFISCDKNQLKQVFINLLKNAIEAMESGGIITIETKIFGDKIQISLTDTGSGIPKQIVERIGEPFFTTKANGTGLGIMVSKQIVENHNGSFHIYSDEIGTTVDIILPI